MCGIAGLIGPGARDPSIIARMTDRLAHRGPDDRGLWSDNDAGIAFGHRRLAIVDLSAAGHEPMNSASGRLTVTFNGEIYNHADLRRQLDETGKTPSGGWRGHSDIETFIEAVEHWGLEAALEASAGMYAMAIWDRRDRRLRLVRDRFGEKPLYYGWVGRDLLFASELKALTTHPDFSPEVDREALRMLTERQYIGGPLSIYRHIYKLRPGAILTLGPEVPPRASGAPEPGGGGSGLSLDLYYDYRDTVRAGLANPFAGEGEGVEALDEALRRSIGGQAMADVPVGVFLSGGLDSSTVTALYQQVSDSPIRSFSIGFREDGYDEAGFARQVAAHLGTVHKEHYVSAEEALDVVPLLADMYDEPFADVSQIPTYLVSKFARSDVTVALTGDGGDELFAGYNRHLMADRVWSRLERVPQPIRQGLLGPALAMPDSVVRGAARLGGFAGAASQPDKIRKFMRTAARARELDDVLRGFLDEWDGTGGAIVAGGKGDRLAIDSDLGDGAGNLVRAAFHDAITYMVDDVLVKVDRASMAVALETRVPMLDHRVAAVAARIPAKFKRGEGGGKLPLRRLLDRHVPTAMIDRPKAGFTVPLHDWLRGPLRKWADDLLDPAALESHGWFDVQRVGREWQGIKTGRTDRVSRLWPILMAESWSRRWL